MGKIKILCLKYEIIFLLYITYTSNIFNYKINIILGVVNRIILQLNNCIKQFSAIVFNCNGLVKQTEIIRINIGFKSQTFVNNNIHFDFHYIKFKNPEYGIFLF
jgi:hypothetical protein